MSADHSGSLQVYFAKVKRQIQKVLTTAACIPEPFKSHLQHLRRPESRYPDQDKTLNSKWFMKMKALVLQLGEAHKAKWV